MSDFAMKRAMQKRMAKCPGADCPGCSSAQCMAEGGETSTTGNKTKTGGSNPGGASTGGAGTVTITTGKNPPNIEVHDVGGRTDARNAGGMDPGDEKEDEMAEGGEVEDSGSSMPSAVSGTNVHPEDDALVMRIMKKRYSQGGMVANAQKIIVDPAPNNFDDLSLRDGLEFSYTGANSGDEIGDEQEDEDRKDIVKRIMKSRAKKDRNPRPA